MLHSGNLKVLKNVSNISYALSCKKSKAPRNKHFKYAKKDLGNIKLTKDCISQDPTFSLIFILVSCWQENKEVENTFWKS